MIRPSTLALSIDALAEAEAIAIAQIGLRGQDAKSAAARARREYAQKRWETGVKLARRSETPRWSDADLAREVFK